MTYNDDSPQPIPEPPRRGWIEFWKRQLDAPTPYHYGDFVITDYTLIGGEGHFIPLAEYPLLVHGLDYIRMKHTSDGFPYFSEFDAIGVFQKFPYVGTATYIFVSMDNMHRFEKSPCKALALKGLKDYFFLSLPEGLRFTSICAHR